MISKLLELHPAVKFVITFLSLFAVFYFFNILYIGITSPGNHYNQFLDTHLNYIRLLRHILLGVTAWLVNHTGHTAITNDTDILVVGHGSLKLIYSCLGLGIISFFSAFVIAYPKKLKVKLIFLISGILGIQLLNICRFFILAIFWNKNEDGQIIDHHTVFNMLIYIIIAVTLYFWVKHDDKKPAGNAAN